MSSAVTPAQSGTIAGRRKISIRRRVIVLIVLVSIPLIGERIYSLYGERQAAIAETVEELQQIAADVGLSQKETIAVATAVAQLVSLQATTLLNDPTACNAFLRRIASDVMGLRSVMIADRTGIARCSSTRELLGFNLAEARHVQRAIQIQGPVLSDFIVSRRTGLSLVSVAEAQRDEAGAVEAIAVAAVDLEWISQVLARAAGAPGVTVAVLDGKGVVLARYPARATLVGKPFGAADLIARMGAEDRGTFRASEGEDDPRIYAFSRIPGTDVRIIADMREAEAAGAFDQRIMTTLALFILVIVVFIGLALYLARKMIVAPVNRLAEDLLVSGESETHTVRDSHITEFEPVVTAYAEMSRRLTTQTSNLRSLNHRLAALASTDGLTGLVNRRSFDVQFSEEWVRWADAKGPLSLIMADVDHFKLFNDSRGHLAGDEALRGVARMLDAAVSGTPHVAARYGGEEFIILMAGADMTSAIDLAETMRQLVLALGVPHPRAPLGLLTASFGVATMVPMLDVSPDVLLARVDAALYDAKRLGRNRVVGARDVQMPAAS